MPAPFAAIEQRINAAVESRLANAEADFGGAVGVVSGIFRRPAAVALGFVAGNAPEFECVADRIATVDEGDALTIGAEGFTVSRLRPDGAGMVVIELEAA